MKQLLVVALISALAASPALAQNKKQKGDPELPKREKTPYGETGQSKDPTLPEREKTEYLQNDKSVNIRFSPLGLLIGYLNVDADFKINRAWTLGPSVSYWSLKFNDSVGTSATVSVLGFGVRGNWHFNGDAMEDGWYLGPSARYVTVKGESSTEEVKVSGFVIDAIVGHQWMWDSFNINLGAGFAASTAASAKWKNKTTGEETGASSNAVGGGLALEFTMGFAF